MELEDAKKLMSLQSCITHFHDRFLNELEKLPDSPSKTELIKGIKGIMGENLTELIFPIIQEHSSLNPYGKNPITSEWFTNAKKVTMKAELNAMDVI